jgi:hypothetical protein
MKKFNKIILSLTALIAMFSFVGCENNSKSQSTECNHNWGDWKTIIAATCETSGLVGRTCTYNETHTQTKITDALEHNYTENVTEPTCTKNGYTTYTCTKCGNSYTDNSTEKLGHQYIDGKCVNCQMAEPVLCDHDWGDWETIIPATCTASGSSVRVCSYDGTHVQIEYIGALNHNYKETITEPTCTTTGYTTHTCTRCGDSYTDTATEKLAHSFVDGKCENCDATDPNYNALTYILKDDNTYEVYCNSTKVTAITIPSTYNDKQVTSIGKDAFMNCDELTTVVIPDSVTSIEAEAFYFCNNLEKVTFSQNLLSIGDYAFYQCENLTNLNLPDSLTTIGVGTFRKCDSITNVILPNNLTTMDYFAFDNCDNLISVTIPGSLTTIPQCAFNLCRNLKTVVIQNGVTEIDDNAFEQCGITSITIPSSITKIGKKSFYNCSQLTSVTFESTNGWSVISNSGGTANTIATISSINLADTSSAAILITKTYADCVWEKA